MCFLLTNTGKISGNDENNTDNVCTITIFCTEAEFHRNFVAKHGDPKRATNDSESTN